MNFTIFSFDTLDSTSTKAMQLAAAGQKTPFCVWTKTQTAGRGRRGKSWLGAPGNLYLTLVLPNTNNHFTEKGLLPLAVATIVVDWINEYFNVLTRIKWPNDIFFGTQKLAGILCESSIQGTEWSNTFIGIGINLNHIPREELEYGVCSIAGVSAAGTIDVETSVKALANYFAKHWSGISEAHVPLAFAKKSLHVGLPWQQGDDASTLFQNAGLQPGGGFDFATAGGTGMRSWTSAHHDLQCIYFRLQSPSPFFVADIGNTAIKLGCYASHRQTELPETQVIINREFSQNRIREAVRAISPADWNQPGYWPFYIASVNREVGDRLFALLKDIGFYPVMVAKRPVYRRAESGYALEDLGIDRLALIEAWLKSCRLRANKSRGKVGILLSAGTATTIDIVESSGRHVTGEILPGLQMALTALSQQTSLLPLVDLSNYESISAPGMNTVTAMTRAVLDMTVGAVRQCIASYLATDKNMSGDVEIVLTGGYARLLTRELGVEESKITAMSGLRILVLGA